ncbi:MAG: ABC-F family ATP-binding cassette domain-containing protein [Lentisphaerae bacterium]|nr:ABC-F family ATP-binding cassette domain-containing protein [Lentisphaerota bacterium]
MIDFKNISKTYSGEYILKDVNCRINTGERVGVVGPNGAGKSTLFGMVTGEIVPDSGEIVIPKDSRLGIMRQHIAECDLGRSLLEFTSDAIPELKTYSAELEKIENLMAECEDDALLDTLLKRHGFLQSSIEHLGAYHLDVEAKQALTSLGFPVAKLDDKLSSFSGGWQMRAALARVLISRPDILLLDEPSNYLDIPAVEWLCRFLANFQGTLLLISHDRFLLRKLADITLEVNRGTVTRYAGNYDFYRREREQRKISLEAAKRNADHKKEQLERMIDRFRAKSTKAAAAKSAQKKLDRIEDVKLTESLDYHGVIRFPEPPPAGAEAARIENLSFGYTPDKLLFEDVSLDIPAGEKLAIIGYNGMGKTTLLKLIAGILKPLSGRIVPGHHIQIGYQAQEFAELVNDELSVYDAVRAALPPNASTANVANVAGAFGFSGDAMKKPCGVLSGGEKIRLQMARIFVNPPNFLILDEPTTHLDLAARELLQEAVRNYSGTVAMVSHDIEFVRNTAQTVWEVAPGKVTKFYGDYDYYLEKSAALNAADPMNSVSRAFPDANGENTISAKDRRRARAQARSAIQQQLNKAKKEVEKLEALLDQQSSRKAVIVAKLASGEKVDFAKLNTELAALDKQITETESKWEEQAMELEALRQENDRINS